MTLKNKKTISTLVLTTFLALSCDPISVEEAADFRDYSQEYRVDILPQFYSLNQDFGLTGPANLDVLLVIDDSASMANVQIKACEGVSQLTSQLRSAGSNLHWRIAVTSTNISAANLANRVHNKGEFYGDGNTLSIDCTADTNLKPDIGNGTFYLDSDTVTDESQQDNALRNAINSLALAGSGSEEGIEVARQIVAGNYQSFFRSGSYRAVIFVSDENECSNGSGNGSGSGACTTRPAQLFSAMKTQMGGVSDEEVVQRVSSWGILRIDSTSRFDLYQEAIQRLDGPATYDPNGTYPASDPLALVKATMFYPFSNSGSLTTDEDGHILSIGTNASNGASVSDYNEFLSKVGQVIASQALSFAGTDTTALPGIETSGLAGFEEDLLSFYIDGEKQSDVIWAATCGGSFNDAPAAQYCIDTTTSPGDLLFTPNFLLQSRMTNKEVVVRWIDADPNLTINREYALQTKPDESTLVVTHIDGSDTETVLTSADYTYQQDTRTIQIDPSYTLAIGDQIRVEYRGAGF